MKFERLLYPALSLIVELQAALLLLWVLAILPPVNGNEMKKKAKAMMLGVGLDSDGSKRLTKGSNFAIVGGSKETHEIMTEKVIKINEKLSAKGKDLDSVSRAEFEDMAHDVGLKRHAPHLN